MLKRSDHPISLGLTELVQGGGVGAAGRVAKYWSGSMWLTNSSDPSGRPLKTTYESRWTLTLLPHPRQDAPFQTASPRGVAALAITQIVSSTGARLQRPRRRVPGPQHPPSSS